MQENEGQIDGLNTSSDSVAFCIFGLLKSLDERAFVWMPNELALTKQLEQPVLPLKQQGVWSMCRVQRVSAWILAYNFGWSNRHRGDIDIVPVSPAGIEAMEVKSFANPTRNVGDRWENRGGWCRRTVTRNPTKQMRRNAEELKDSARWQWDANLFRQTHCDLGAGRRFTVRSRPGASCLALE